MAARRGRLPRGARSCRGGGSHGVGIAGSGAFCHGFAPRIRKNARHGCSFEALRGPTATRRGRVLPCTFPLGSCGERLRNGGSFAPLNTRRRIRNLTNFLKIFLPPRARPVPVGGCSLVVLEWVGEWLPWLAARPLRGRMEMKKRVLESMPTLEVLAQTRLIRMGERARMGTSCLMESDKVEYGPCSEERRMKMC